jgi:hypothetical protein
MNSAQGCWLSCLDCPAMTGYPTDQSCSCMKQACIKLVSQASPDSLSSSLDTTLGDNGNVAAGCLKSLRGIPTPGALEPLYALLLCCTLHTSCCWSRNLLIKAESTRCLLGPLASLLPATLGLSCMEACTNPMSASVYLCRDRSVTAAREVETCAAWLAIKIPESQRSFHKPPSAGSLTGHKKDCHCLVGEAAGYARLV